MNNNLKMPAFPFAWEAKEDKDGKVFSVVTHTQNGFTKLEQAALMLAPAFVERVLTADYVAAKSVEFAKAILEECNKQI